MYMNISRTNVLLYKHSSMFVHELFMYKYTTKQLCFVGCCQTSK